jgi:putative FmdB family regulatory protein
MPIYEFKCSKCNEFFEILVLNSNDEKEMKCPKCNSLEFERVVSRTNYAVASPSSGNKGVARQERNCSTGSCTTYTIPGESRG